MFKPCERGRSIADTDETITDTLARFRCDDRSPAKTFCRRRLVSVRASRLTFDLPIIWPTDAEALQAVANYRRFHLSRGIGLIDTLIAATALSLNAPLCTFNLKHFRHIPGLVTEQPYTR